MKPRTIIALLALLLVGGAAAWKFIPHTLGYDECSDVYRHFADMRMEGVRVTYVQDKVINDTLRLPVTVLEAESVRGWQQIDSLYGITKNLEALLNNPDIPDDVKETFRDQQVARVSVRTAHRETPEKSIGFDDPLPDDVQVYIYPQLRVICIFETGDVKSNRDALMDVAWDKVDSIDATLNHQNI
jgi:hypothetical protein